jgi:hypothetical protein
MLIFIKSYSLVHDKDAGSNLDKELMNLNCGYCPLEAI